MEISWKFFAVLAVLAVCGCSRDAEREAIVTSPKDLVGRKCGVMLGTVGEEILLAHQPGIVTMSFNDMPSAIEAVKLGKVDAFSIDGIILRSWAARSGGQLIATPLYSRNPCAFIFPKGSKLRERFNETLARWRTSGDLDRIISKWSDASNLETVEFEDWSKKFPDFTGEGGVLKVATTAELEPCCFMRRGEAVGFDIDFMRCFAVELNKKLEITNYSAPALVPAVQIGKADIGANSITITKERAEKVDFSDKYLDDGLALIVRNPDWRKEDANSGSVWQSLGESFRRTFVVEARWKLLGSGLGITLFIALLASVLGTLLSFPVWLARTSKIGFISSIARVYIAILQGTPVLVLLMVLFYLVFGKVNIDGIWVAVIGFALNLSAYAGEMLRSGVNSIPIGQTEAALALGYTPRQAFSHFVLPQAVRAVLPVYRGELIGLLKSTSIVGYIAICDLTKASDLVRSRTYESFFPLITTAIIYFLVSWLMAAALERFGKLLDPASRRVRKSKVEG